MSDIDYQHLWIDLMDDIVLLAMQREVNVSDVRQLHKEHSGKHVAQLKLIAKENQNALSKWGAP